MSDLVISSQRGLLEATRRREAERLRSFVLPLLPSPLLLVWDRSIHSLRDDHVYPHRISGLNLENPESARKIVKTWDERHDMEVYCDSGVDDQVSHPPFLGTKSSASMIDTINLFWNR